MKRDRVENANKYSNFYFTSFQRLDSPHLRLQKPTATPEGSALGKASVGLAIYKDSLSPSYNRKIDKTKPFHQKSLPHSDNSTQSSRPYSQAPSND